MRLPVFISAALIWSLTAPALAQEWVEFVNREDGFKIVFPGEPRVQQATYTSQQGYTLPSRIYSAENGQQRFSVTVVDYRGIERQGIARAKACPAGAEPCRGGQVEGVIGPGYWKMDVRGAITFALLKLLQRNARLTSLTWDFQDLVEGLLLQLTNNADQSRTYAALAMHDNRLYIIEGTVPSGYPEPGFFQQTMGFVDRSGNGIRYQTIYSNAYHGLGEYPVPPLTGGGRGGGAGAAGAAAAAAGTAGAAQAAPAAPAQPAPGPRIIATYVEVAPASEAQALTLIRAYRDASRRDEGYVKVDILQQNGRRGHFAIIEEWRDESAWKNHRASAHVAQFHEKLTPLRVTSYDERTHTVFAVGSPSAAPADAVQVVTHVDVVPNGLPKAREFLSAQVEASRKEAGNMRFDVLQGARMNHFTVVETWRDERAREAHVAAAHSRAYREGLRETAVDGAPYDERLYRLVP